MVTINLGNSAGNTASASYTLSEGCSDSIINGMIPSVEWMTAIASNGTISITATEDNPTTSERSGYITPLINGESCTNNRFKVTQAAGEEPGPEPPTECTCLVDNCAEPDNLHTSNLDATGETTCDSAWAQNPYNYEWSVEYATSSSGPWTPSGSGWLTPSIGPKSLCVSGSTGQANYTATANDGAVRWARVHWTWKNETKEEGMCNDSYAYFKQLSSEPAEPCDVKLTLAGLEGTDKATIAWGDGSTDTNVGNEQTTHTYQDGEGHSATITADGYKTVTVNLDCNDEVTKTMEKSAGVCGCITITESNVAFTKEGGSITAGTASCDFIPVGFPNWVTVTKNGNNIVLTAEEHTGQSHGGGGSIQVDGENCGSITVSQEGSVVYNVVIKGHSSAEGTTGMKAEIIYDKDGGTHTPTITNGKMRLKYFNCNSQTENPDNVPSPHTVNFCTAGSGTQYAVEYPGTSFSIESISCTVGLAGETFNISSGGSHDVVLPTQGITYHVTCE